MFLLSLIYSFPSKNTSSVGDAKTPYWAVVAAFSSALISRNSISGKSVSAISCIFGLNIWQGAQWSL